MLETVGSTLVHLFDSVHCRLLDKSDVRYDKDVLIVWSVNDDFAVKLFTDGSLKYEDYTAPTYSQYLHSVRELNELINYFN